MGFDYMLELDEKTGGRFMQALCDLAKQRTDPFNDDQYLYGLDWWNAIEPDTQYYQTWPDYETGRRFFDTEDEFVESQSGPVDLLDPLDCMVRGVRSLPREMTPTLWEYFEVDPPPGKYIIYFEEISWLYRWPAAFRERVYKHFDSYACGEIILQILADGIKNGDKWGMLFESTIKKALGSETQILRVPRAR